MQTTITHTCQHSETVQLYGPGKDRDSRASWLASKPCNDCQRQTGLADAERLSESIGLPALLGSPKQIEWATKIRVDCLRMLDEERARLLDADPNGDPREFDRAVAALRTITDSRWWIDNRGYNAGMLLRQGIAATAGHDRR